MLNTQLPKDEGFYLLAAILTVASLILYPVWIYWVIQMGFLLKKAHASSRHKALVIVKRFFVGLLGFIFALVYAIIMIINTPTPKTNDVPSVPSAAGTVRYMIMMAFADQFALPSDYSGVVSGRKDESFTRPEFPPNTNVKNVNAGGIPAEYICSEKASDDRVVLYLPGGGFLMPPDNSIRAFAANISRETGACILLTHYRLAPENSFPAAVQDNVKAYRWILEQGVPTSRIVIMGDSAGGNLALTTTLALRDSGNPLPAALIAISSVTDFTLSGKTFRTKVNEEPLLRKDVVEYTVTSYTKNRTVNLRDPLLSPLYADLEKGFPPTLLMIGSQEVLLSDVMRMADKLQKAHIPVALEVWPGMPHSWNSAAREHMETRLALQHISTFILNHMK